MKTQVRARIYWDNQDPNNRGWAWSTRVDDEHDSSGGLDGVPQDDSPTDDELIAALRSDVLNHSASESLADDDIEIIR